MTFNLVSQYRYWLGDRLADYLPSEVRSATCSVIGITCYRSGHRLWQSALRRRNK